MAVLGVFMTCSCKKNIDRGTFVNDQMISAMMNGEFQIKYLKLVRNITKVSNNIGLGLGKKENKF
jgi:hypothetical protein